MTKNNKLFIKFIVSVVTIISVGVLITWLVVGPPKTRECIVAENALYKVESGIDGCITEMMWAGANTEDYSVMVCTERWQKPLDEARTERDKACR